MFFLEKKNVSLQFTVQVTIILLHIKYRCIYCMLKFRLNMNKFMVVVQLFSINALIIF